MDKKAAKKDLWFGVYGKEYTGDEPAFFDDDFPWRKTLEENFDVIKTELLPLMAGGNSSLLQPYFDETAQFPPKRWKVLMFLMSGVPNYKVAKRFPRLMQIFHRIPGLVTAWISLLEPNSCILPHTGETNGVFRVHLGLSIPGGEAECAFTVKGETRPWRVGELLVFLDAFRHEACNKTSKGRYVLVLDIVRPEFISQKKYMCVTSLSMLSLNWLLAHLPRSLVPKRREGKAGTYPGWFISTVLFPFRIGWYIIWPLIRM